MNFILLTVFISSIIHIYKLYCLVNLDKYVHPWNRQPDQLYTEQFHQPGTLPSCKLPAKTPQGSSLSFGFCLVLPVWHIAGILPESHFRKLKWVCFKYYKKHPFYRGISRLKYIYLQLNYIKTHCFLITL
jgi:hypothetical protein